MITPTYRTWTAGEVVTAAYMNSNVRDAGNFFLSVPVFEGRQTIVQSINNSTSTPITFDAEDVDNDNGHSTSTNTSRYTPQTAGRFQLSGAISWASNATGLRNAEWWKNGSAVNGAGTSFTTINGSTTRYPARMITELANGSTDYFELTGFQTSGAALNTAVGLAVEQPTFSVRWVGTL
jgi:hypothetical protein